MNVIIAEKPSVAREIAKVLNVTQKEAGYLYNDRYAITWAFGHLIGLKTPEELNNNEKIETSSLPFIPKEIYTKSVGDKTAKNQLKVIETLFKKADLIIVATDAGREGELIFRLIYNHLNINKPFKRLWISSVNPTVIKEGLNNLKNGELYDNLYYSGKNRQLADWLLGYNTSIAISRINGFTIRLGRVKTPTLFLVVKRYLENKQFKPQKYFVPAIKLYNSKNNTELIANYEDSIFNDDELFKLLGYIEASKEAKLIDILKEEKKESSPKLFDLGAAQKLANQKFGFTADQTLSLIQSLYEKGIVTYPRTDSNYLNEEMEMEVWERIQELGKEYNLTSYTNELLNNQVKTSFNNSKVTDHHAIIPDKNIPNLSNLIDTERKMYVLIMIQFFKAFSQPLIKDVTTYEFSVNRVDIPFISKGVLIKQKGFKSYDSVFNNLLGNSKQEDDIEEVSNDELKLLPEFDLGTYPITDILKVEKITKAPPLLTDATLIGQMETCGKEVEDENLKEALKGKGIGTPATRSEIIKELIESNYVERNKKNLLPTKFGFEIVKALNGQKILSPQLTGEWEYKLSLIEKGEYNKDLFFEEIKDYTKLITNDILNKTQKLDYNPYKTELDLCCPKCKSKLIEEKFNFLCSNKSCELKIQKIICNHQIKEKELKILLNGQAVKNVKLKNKEGKSFTSNLILDNDFKIQFQFEENKKSFKKNKNYDSK